MQIPPLVTFYKRFFCLVSNGKANVELRTNSAKNRVLRVWNKDSKEETIPHGSAVVSK